MENHSISDWVRTYQVQLLGVAAAFLTIVVVRVFLSPKRKSNNTANANDSKSEESSSTSSGDVTEVNVDLSSLKDGEPKQIDVGESGAIVVVKDKNELHAFGAKCTHAGAPLKSGFYQDGRIRCPWHGACFNTKTGDIEDYPCNDAIHAFKSSIKGNTATVRVPNDALKNWKRTPSIPKSPSADSRVFVIVGAGAAGLTAAETLRQSGFGGRVVLIGREQHLPYDRTKLSKQMESTADKIQLRPAKYFEDARIELQVSSAVTAVSVPNHTVTLANGNTIKYDKLLLCTGGDARTLPVPGKELRNIFPLRVPDDSQNIVRNVDGKRLVIVGTSFIGMEAASCLFKKAKSIVAIGMENVPFERVLGTQVGTALQKLFESNNVQFRLKRTVKEFKGVNGAVSGVVLDNGEELEADICILGAGIIPSTSFLDPAQFKFHGDKSIITDDHMLAAQDVYAVGDIARFPYQYNNELIRVEHYAYAQFQARAAARNMIGNSSEAVRAVPFFWTTVFGKRIVYAGHALAYDEVIVDGSVADLKFVAYYLHKNKVMAVIALGRDPIASKAAEYFQAGIMPSGEQIKAGKFL